MTAGVTIGMPFLEPVWPYVDPATDFTPVSLNVVYNVYERLVELSGIDADGFQITPGLATHWTLSPDGRTYGFELRTEARFASGRPVTAGDVVFSLDRLRRLAKPPSHLLPLADARVAGDSRVELVLERPSVAALAALASPAYSVVDRRAVDVADDLGQAWLTAHSAGSGPYVLQSLTDHEVVLAANHDHWQGAPHLDRVAFIDTPEPAKQMGLLRSGRADVLLAVGPRDFEEAAGDPDLVAEHAASIQCPNLTLLKGTTGPDGRPLSGNHAFTEAMKYSIDYDAIAKLLGGWGNGVFPAQAGLIPSVCGYDRGLAAYYRRDPARVAELLSKAGYPAGLDVDFPYWTGSWGGVDTASVARSVEQDLREVGIRPQLKSYPGEEYFSLLLDQQVLTGMTLSMSIYQMPDPEDVFRRKMTYLNLTGYQLDADAALDTAAAEPDRQRRSDQYRALQLRFLTEAPMIFLLTYPHRVVRRRDITGYRQRSHWPGPCLAELDTPSRRTSPQ